MCTRLTRTEVTYFKCHVVVLGSLLKPAAVVNIMSCYTAVSSTLYKLEFECPCHVQSYYAKAKNVYRPPSLGAFNNTKATARVSSLQ